MRIKVIECIQGLAILVIIMSATLILGGAEYQNEWNSFVWQFRKGISYILLAIVVAGCMELLKRYEIYRTEKEADRIIKELWKTLEDNKEKAQRSGNSR